jgi:hypothetical protein
MDDSNKKKDLLSEDLGNDLPGPIDTTGRARNKTLMLTPEMTGHMRARMIDAGNDSTSMGNPSANDWGVGQNQKAAFGGRLISHEPRVEDENPDWTRPIGPATFSDDDDGSSNGHSSIGRTDPSEMSWSPQSYTNGYEGDRYSSGTSGRGQSRYEEADDNAPFVSAGGSRSSADSEPRSRTADYGREQDFAGSSGAKSRRDTSAGREAIEWKTMSPITGFLVTYDKDPLGVSIELRSGRVIVTSEPTSSGNVLFLDDPSVSPMHAIMRVGSGSQIQLLDQLSESGTRIVRAKDGQEEILSGEKSNLEHGDVVCFGERKFHVCIVMKGVASE